MVLFAHLRMLLVVLAALALVSGTAVAQSSESADDPPAETDTEPESNDGETGESDAKKKKNNKKKNGKKGKGADELSLCETEDSESEPVPDDDADEATADDEPRPEPEPECQPPPRCKGAEIDLAPDEDEPNCIDQSRLNRLIGEFEAAAADEARTLEELSEALDQLADLNAQLVALQLRLGEIQLRLASARADAGFAALRQSIASESLDDVSSALAAEEDQLRRQAVEAYMGGDEIALATTAVVGGLESYSDVETAREYAEAIINSQLTTIDEVDALRLAVVSLGEVVATIELAADADA